MVWRQLPKLVPAGSIPVSCSKMPRVYRGAFISPYIDNESSESRKAEGEKTREPSVIS